MSKDWILCSGMIAVNKSLWEKILNKSIEYRSMELLNYLSCSENSQIIIHYLNLTLKSELFNQTTLPIGRICRSIVKKHVSKDEVLRSVLKNYDKILKRYFFSVMNIM